MAKGNAAERRARNKANALERRAAKRAARPLTFDTSFNFGANVASKGTRRRKAAGTGTGGGS